MYQRKQRGSIEGVVILCLVLALITALGWIFWQNFIHKEPNAKTKDVVVVDKKQDTSEKKNQDITYNPEVAVSSSADLNKLKDAPSEFKSFIAEKYLKDNVDENAGCKAGVLVSRIYKQAYAVGGYGVLEGECVGGTKMIWAKSSSGTWVEAGATQNEGFLCSNLEKYSIPSEIAGKECMKEGVNGGEGSMVPYSQE